ncbi:uroporphyrinogen-III synthase [Metabacillus idriensis]|uniref:uroporphyrinogen-III synthase n=1 Tax=Metabacillus idriensis TaxID=324768 RepID=UPI00174B8926|nr:uroporphyrinogen-III synthase [Metabacillus idriensis]
MAAALSGKKILITRELTQATTFAEKIKNAGGVPIVTPLIRFEKAKNEEQIHEIIMSIKPNDCLVFTSTNGVSYFFDFLKNHQINKSKLSSCTFAAVGRKTKQLIENNGFPVTIIPQEYVAEKLVEEIAEKTVSAQHIFLFRGNLAREILIKELRHKGYSVTDVTLYETIHNVEDGQTIERLLKQNELDYITFTSSSTVDAFMNVMQTKDLVSLLGRVTLVSIGPITMQTLSQYGFKGIVCETYTIDAMIDRIKTHIESKGND